MFNTNGSGIGRHVDGGNEVRERVRGVLLQKRRDGMLGVVAARAGVAEHLLSDWCDDPSKVPDAEPFQKIKDRVLQLDAE